MTEQETNTPEAKPYLMLLGPITNPQVLIEEFFKAFHLQDAQEEFWQIVKGALASTHYDSPRERSNLLFYAELITQLFAAVQQIHAPHAAVTR
jgi:hypothetical protein